MSNFILYNKSREFNQLLHKTINFSQLDHTLRDQLNRASSSIQLNIAEGNGRFTTKEKRNFFSIARGSANESMAIIDLLTDRNILEKDSGEELRSILLEVIKISTTIINKLR